jgi:hypothetical protein
VRTAVFVFDLVPSHRGGGPKSAGWGHPDADGRGGGLRSLIFTAIWPASCIFHNPFHFICRHERWVWFPMRLWGLCSEQLAGRSCWVGRPQPGWPCSAAHSCGTHLLCNCIIICMILGPTSGPSMWKLAADRPKPTSIMGSEHPPPFCCRRSRRDGLRGPARPHAFSPRPGPDRQPGRPYHHKRQAGERRRRYPFRPRPRQLVREQLCRRLRAGRRHRGPAGDLK